MVTYWCTYSLSANNLQSWPSAVGGSRSFDIEDSIRPRQHVGISNLIMSPLFLWFNDFVAFSMNFWLYNGSSIKTMFIVFSLMCFHEIFLQWLCCSITAAASKRPMPLKIFVKLDTAKISLFLASHKCRMASVGLGLVAKKVTYRCTFSLSANSLQSWPSAVGGSRSFDKEDSMLALRRKRPASETKLLFPFPVDWRLQDVDRVPGGLDLLCWCWSRGCCWDIFVWLSCWVRCCWVNCWDGGWLRSQCTRRTFLSVRKKW